MQKFFYLFCIVLLVSCKKTQSPSEILEIESRKEISSVAKKKIPRLQNNYQTLNLQGKVKSIVCTSYKQFVPTTELSNLVTKVDYYFNEKGNVDEEIIYLATGEIHRYKYFYDEIGNRIKSLKIDDYNRNIVVSSSLLNEKGLELNTKSTELSKTKDYKDTIIIFENIFKYSTSTDTLLGYTFYNKMHPEDSIRNVCHYDNGNLIKQINYSKGRAWGLTTYQYDKRNNIVSQSEYDDDFKNPSRTQYFRYDEKNRQVSWKIDSFENNYTNEIEKFYDDYNNITKEIYTENGKVNEKISYQYFYKYDHQKNWIQQIRQRLNGTNVSVLNRKITYY